MTSPQIEAFAQLGQLWKQTQTEFAESLPVSDPDVLQMVQDLLEEETGPVDRIVDLTIDDADTFRGRAEQRISLGRSQTLQFVISPERMSYKLVGNVSFGETDGEWAEIIEFAAKTKKKLNCKPGNVQCGGKCQSGSKNCFADMSPEQKKKAQSAARKVKKSSPNPAPVKKAGIDRSDHKSLIAGGREFTEKYKLDSDLKPTKKEESLLRKKQKLAEELLKNPTFENQSKFTDLEADYFLAKVDREARVEIKMKSLLEDLQAGGLSKPEAMKLVKNTDIDLAKSKGWNAAKKRSIPSDLADFHQLTGGSVQIDRILANKDRAHANLEAKIINIGKSNGTTVNRETLFHESGHHLEYSDPRLATASRDWLESRSISPNPRPINDINGGNSYRPDEVALEDKWVSSYVGKIYGDKGAPTEVISMGLEYFSSTRAMARLAMTDREHFEFILGVLISGRES